MFEIANKVYSLLTKSERREAMWLILAILVMAFFEVVGIASVFPFMQVVINPQSIHTSAKLVWLYNALNFADTSRFLLFLGICVLGLVLVSIAFTAYTNWVLLKFTYMRGYTLSTRLFAKYIYKDYDFFLLRNSADLNGSILSEVSQMVSGVLMPGMQMIAKTIVAVFILGLLVIMDPLLALVGGSVLCGAYIIFYLLIHKKTKKYGKARLSASQERFKVTAEGFGGIKEIKLLHAENVFVGLFSEASRKFAYFTSMNQTISQLPKSVMEAITFGGVLLSVLYLLSAKRNVEQIVPMISVYVFAGYRLIPALQQIFAGVTTARFYKPSLDSLFTDLCGEQAGTEAEIPAVMTSEALPFNDRLRMEDVTFTYAGSPEPVLSSMDITIKARTKVAFVGSTGAGKTTIVDMFLGLLLPQKGRILVDGMEIDRSNIRKWQKNIGYVPQTIFLADDTISRNIAFGVHEDQIDLEAVKAAARAANIHDFISKELPDGYSTTIGERGVRLSGGQRQRIGIARALYRDPAVLIFDEATNALDGVTEDAVVQAINNLSSRKTVIVIAHRLSTVKDSDIIYVLEKGKLVGQGVYHELLNNCAAFNVLAKAGS